MINFSRRTLAQYALERLIAKESPTKIARSLAAALIASGKQKEADLLSEDISQALEDKGLLAQAIVTSASDLSASLKKQLATKIKQASKVDEVSIKEVIDENVIGGIAIETTNHNWDMTILKKLSEIKGGI